MKGKLNKQGDRWVLYNEDSSKIALSTESPFYKLSLKNCEAIANGYDLDEIRKLADEDFESELGDGPTNNESINSMLKKSNANGAEWGFQKAIELKGNKKYADDDIVDAYMAGHIRGMSINMGEDNIHPICSEYLNSLQQTEWDVEIVMDKDCYSSAGRCDKLIMVDCIICTPVTYLKDVDGCLILKRI